jgi:hypothetical protein
VCSTRILPPLAANKLRERLRQPDERFGRKSLAAVRQFFPQSLKSSLMTSEPPDVRVGEGTLVEAALPFGYRGNGRAVGASHRAGADAAILGEVPERSNRHRGIRLRPLVLDQSAQLQVAMLDAPYKRRLGGRSDR